MKRVVSVLLSGLILFAATVQAETIYVSDRLEASLRRGAGLEFKVIKMVRSGDRLEVLERDRAKGYTKVRASNGTEGWILTRYLMNETAARDRLAATVEENTQLRSTIEELQNKIAELEETSTSQAAQIDTLQTDKATLDEELTGIREATADVMAIKRQNQTLASQLEVLNQEKEELMKENRIYQDNTRQDWFIRGAAVVIAGILIGLILPKLRRRQRWGDL
ncbi:TIGR04211 family SH3 domain-containing protein [Granulosicoccaceae sp. 1_MG-2023]|nr:TIGR04211 family SH3 domain-containing protein [Granulosicoccaceae sp. 1_MG-2023]